MIALSIRFDQNRRLFRIDTGSTTYAFAVSEQNRLCHVYYGQTLCGEGDLDSDLQQLTHSENRRGVDDDPLQMWEYASSEPFDFLTPAVLPVFSATHCGVSLRYTEHQLSDHQLDIVLRDPEQSVEVVLHYRLFHTPGIIARSATVKNIGETPFHLHAFFSASLSLPSDNWKASYYTGRWGAEYSLVHSSLSQGCFTLSNRRGTCASHQCVPFVALGNNATEEYGDLFFLALAWSGDYQIHLESDASGSVRITAGISSEDLDLPFSPGDSLTSPEVFIGFTPNGFGGMSRLLYDLEYDDLCIRKGSEPIPVIVNSWYPYEFSVTQENCIEMIHKAHSVGAELFVLDDGWMKGRSNDHTGLGDWWPDPERFPDGLGFLSDACHACGMQFGLWVEPEMVNEDSDLYRSHPDWVLHVNSKKDAVMRSQFLLDLTNENVVAWSIATLNRLLSSCRLDYLKWDMNRYMSSPAIRGNVRFYYIQNLYRIWSWLKTAFPNVLLENCASGGGRADFGMLPYSGRINRSDNADPVDVMKIHEGFTALFIPRLAGGAGNICPSPSSINGRSLPLAFRALSGMTGSMSIGINLNHCSPSELEEIRKYIARFKELRNDLHNSYVLRLRSVNESKLSILEYLQRDGSMVILFVFGHGLRLHEGECNIRLRGLAEKAIYTNESGLCMSGSALMHHGIRVGLQGDADACIHVFHKM